MISASLSGRLARDPDELKTKTGAPMTAVSLAVNAGGRGEEATAWVRVICFGRNATRAALHQKGEMLAAMGRLELSRWKGEDGTERESWQLIADALASARLAQGES